MTSQSVFTVLSRHLLLYRTSQVSSVHDRSMFRVASTTLLQTPHTLSVLFARGARHYEQRRALHFPQWSIDFMMNGSTPTSATVLRTEHP